MPLNVNDVIKSMAKKTERRKESFNEILERCYRKIEKCAKHNQTSCYYEVPEIILGHPLYNLNECIVYMLQNLKDSGFLVQYYFPRVIHISWQQPNQEDSFTKNLLALMNSQPVPMLMGPSPPPPPPPPLSLQHVPAPPLSIGTQNQYTPPKQEDKTITLPVMAKKRGQKKATKPIAEFKPSGKFVLNLT